MRDRFYEALAPLVLRSIEEVFVGTRPAASDGNTAAAGRVRASASEIGGPVAGVARATTCIWCWPHAEHVGICGTTVVIGRGPCECPSYQRATR